MSLAKQGCHNPHPPYSAVPQIMVSNYYCAVPAAFHSYSVVSQIMESNHAVPQIMGSNQCAVIYVFLDLFAQR
jgi:hypothetical protein